MLRGSVRKNVLFRPSGQIQLGARGQKIETRLRNFAAAFALKTFIQNLFQTVQVQHITCGVIQLRIGQRGRPLIAHLLMF